MLDRFNRKIYYLRISVTDRCNLRCTYCMPDEGIKLIPRENILSYEEIEEIVRVATKLGFYKFRLTGGEPLVRKGIVGLVARLARIEGVKILTMTTNGLLLPEYAHQLKEDGLSYLNISLDCLNEKRYQEITRGGRLSQVLAGIRAAREAGFETIKLNVVLIDSTKDMEQEGIKRFARENKLAVRFIRKMDLKNGVYFKVEGGDGGNCAICNRIRLTADGKLKPCLFSDYEVDVRKEGLEKAFRKAILGKPERGERSIKRKMYEVGG